MFFLFVFSGLPRTPSRRGTRFAPLRGEVRHSPNEGRFEVRLFNSKQYAEAKDAAAKLRQRYRSAFPRQPVPLKVGIHEDIVADGHFTASEVKLGLGYWVSTRSYLKACARPGAMRHDLNGIPVEPVSPEQAAYAADPHGLKLAGAA